MLQFNVREARQRFKELLDRVERGEEVVVTRRGRIVARWVPPAHTKSKLPLLAKFRLSLGKPGSPSTELVREERDAQ